MSGNFAAEVSAWVQETQQRMDAVFKESCQRTIAKAQTPVGAGGYMPIDTGFLRASVRASTSAMPPIDSAAKPTLPMYAYNSGEVVLTIASAEFGQTIYVGWTANYAAHIHNGTSRMIPRPFATMAALQWESIVHQVGSEAMARALQSSGPARP